MIIFLCHILVINCYLSIEQKPLNSKRAFYRVPTKKEQTQARTMQSIVYFMADDLALFVDEEKHVDTKFVSRNYRSHCRDDNFWNNWRSKS